VADFPDYLYSQGPRDQAQTQIEIFYFQNTQVVAATTIQATFQVPQSRILRVTRVAYDAIAGAAQGKNTFEAGFQPTDRNNVAIDIPYNFVEDDHGFGAPIAKESFHCDIWIPPQSVFYLQTVFNAGAAANTVSHYAFGFLIPRGNVAS